MNCHKHRLVNARIMLALLIHILIGNVTTLKAINGAFDDDHIQLGSNRVLCPSMCICDTYKALNRANCSNEQLISANIGMSVYVELFDLSYNNIHVLDSSCFTPLSRLVHLQLDHNSIQSIDLDAFTALLELKSVSLSHNRLATFDKRIFEQNHQLVEVNLAGNNFMDLKNAPILQSQSLEELDLKESKLTHLHSAFFGELPRLRSLDLAKNLLITINVAAFERNLRLEVVKIDGNPFTCDMQMEMTLLLMKRRNIKTRLKFCPVPKVRQMFERMQMLPAPGSADTTHSNQRQNVTAVWRNTNYSRPILNQVCPLNDTDKACDLFETCALEFSMLLKETEEKLSQKRPMRYDTENNSQAWLHSITVNVAFYGGLCLGSIFGGSCIFICGSVCAKGCKSQKDVEREHRRKHRARTHRSENHAMHQRIELPVRLPEQRQMAPRLEPLPPPARDHEIVEYHHVPAPSRNHNSIFTLLFERPARRRAYRQLNRNATNLVRRLSQSRLFLNSSRAQRNRHPDSAAQTPVTPTTAEPWFDASITPDNVPTLHSASSLPSIDRESNAVPSAPVHTSADDDVFASEPSLCQRAETPPPAYQDILPNLSLSRQSLSHRHSF